ncbi:MAG: bifunctional shikimate kinase/3-dehydroquinate synthase [Actinomycetota bacterium]|nr:MAG: bifunctional shikimate kinase/3-dehydroquinate synthase [Actinomycetota bacterium]
MIVLVGFMGAGKTTIGYLLAEKLGLPFVDVDMLIERRQRRSISQIFEDEGEETFRKIEHETIVETLNGPDAVVALGGGAVEHPGTRLALDSALVVYLEVGYDEAVLRVGHDACRPMMANPNLRDIYNRRLPFYGRVSKLTLHAGHRRPEEIVIDIISKVTTPASIPAGTKSVLVAPMGGAHQVHIGEGLLEHISQLLPDISHAKRIFLVHCESDSLTADKIRLALANSKYEVSFIRVPPGEKAKSFGTVESVCEELADCSAHCDDLVIGVGGEPICYLAGFVAATYNRGMNLALVPTTLYGQVDSAIGGKNGVNLSSGQNMVGTIYQPTTVITDISGSVVHRDYEFRSGLAEMIKHALIADSEFLEILRSQHQGVSQGLPELLGEVVYRSTMIKAAIVTADEREQGERIYLNYGHTFGHAFEQLLPPGPDRHGDATALGMMAAAYLAFRQDRISKDLLALHREVLSLYGLPVAGVFSIDDLNRVWSRNKRYRNGVRFIVLNGIGQPEGGVVADNETLSGVLADLSR